MRLTALGLVATLAVSSLLPSLAAEAHLRSGIRRALVHRFPYAVYFAVEDDVVVVLAVLHASRDPANGSDEGANDGVQPTRQRTRVMPSVGYLRHSA